MKKLSKGKRLREQRNHMWKENPHCENCGCLTILPEDVENYIDEKGLLRIKKTPDNMATIQHKYPRMAENRLITNKSNQKERRRFLWCFKCNNDDNKIEQSKIDVKILQKRAQNGVSNKTSKKN